MEGSIVDQGQRAGRLQQLNHGRRQRPATRYERRWRTRCLRDLSGIGDRGPGARLPRSEGNNALTKWVTPARDRFRDPRAHGVGSQRQGGLGRVGDVLQDVGTYPAPVRLLVPDRRLRGPSAGEAVDLPASPGPVISTEQLNHEIDPSTSRTADVIEQL